MKLDIARAESRAAYPCTLTRRFGQAAAAVENHGPVGNVDIVPGANISCAGVKHPCLLTAEGSSHFAITRCRDGSSPIASALAVSAPALFVFLSHHACRREKTLRSESTIDNRQSTNLSDQITRLAPVCRRCQVTPVELSFTPLENATAAPNYGKLRIGREGHRGAAIVCVSP